MKKFRFLKRDSTISSKNNILKFQFSKLKLDVYNENKLNKSIVPNDSSSFEKTF